MDDTVIEVEELRMEKTMSCVMCREGKNYLGLSCIFRLTNVMIHTRLSLSTPQGHESVRELFTPIIATQKNINFDDFRIFSKKPDTFFRKSFYISWHMTATIFPCIVNGVNFNFPLEKLKKDQEFLTF